MPWFTLGLPLCAGCLPSWRSGARGALRCPLPRCLLSPASPASPLPRPSSYTARSPCRLLLPASACAPPCLWSLPPYARARRAAWGVQLQRPQSPSTRRATRFTPTPVSTARTPCAPTAAPCRGPAPSR